MVLLVLPQVNVLVNAKHVAKELKSEKFVLYVSFTSTKYLITQFSVKRSRWLTFEKVTNPYFLVSREYASFDSGSESDVVRWSIFRQRFALETQQRWKMCCIMSCTLDGGRKKRKVKLEEFSLVSSCCMRNACANLLFLIESCSRNFFVSREAKLYFFS